ncbi:MAG: HD domain-containing protein [Deltaproteobacteria bacterium]|nr:HD domain-containing protein [Deltaproteobacteria bacterium]
MPDQLVEFLEELSGYREESAVLDRILSKAREITRADAGTIFLKEGEDLIFAYTHNDSLFSADEAHRHAYATLRLPLTEYSIAGYVATTGRILNLPDVRAVQDGRSPYHFNNALDQRTGFVTVSMLALPLRANRSQTLGVMQLINSLDPLTLKPVPFLKDMESDCRLLVREVAGTLERSAVERNGIYGMLRMASVHDPFETGPHAERVGAIAAELYHASAARLGHSPEAIRREKSCLRLAAMLHDIGKVGISDLILKKNGRLDHEEVLAMREHARLGGSILEDYPGAIAGLAHVIALHHHQRWDGQGYISGGGEGRLTGEAIPLAARITALADVFDALVSPRCYKTPWTFEAALAHLHEEAGRYFDPDLVACLDEISELLPLIYARFPDKQEVLTN